MSEGAQRHGFGFYPGVPSIDLATLMYDDPDDRSSTRNVSAGPAVWGCVCTGGMSDNRGFAADGPDASGIRDTSTVPSIMTESV